MEGLGLSSVAKKFHLPKVDPQGLFAFKIHRTGIIETRKAFKVILNKQIFEGVVIPNGIEIWIPNNAGYIDKQFSSEPEVQIRGWKVNEFIKMLVMEGLRNG